MEKELHIYLGKFFRDEKELGIMLYVLAEKDSEFEIDSAFSIMKREGF